MLSTMKTVNQVMCILTNFLSLFDALLDELLSGFLPSGVEGVCLLNRARTCTLECCILKSLAIVEFCCNSRISKC